MAKDIIEAVEILTEKIPNDEELRQRIKDSLERAHEQLDVDTRRGSETSNALNDFLTELIEIANE